MSYASVMNSLNKIPLDDGFALHIGGTRIAVGVSDDPIEASENLLDRAADLFYYDVIEA